MKKLLLTAALLAATNAQADCFVNTATADVISTEIAVANGAVEANPLGVGGVIVAKVGVYAAKKMIGGNTEKAIDKVACPIMAGANVNNLGLAAGLASKITLSLGVVGGLLYMSGASFGPVAELYPNDMEVN